ncbi:HTTM domain-containing protein [Actinomycetospora atypica]|uniref:HTTM domain-containing protein n=1 Tax=Actinomycetospora atypica TaxID=1290095 RepID=A0ABV9YNK3_9PSEU
MSSPLRQLSRGWDSFWFTPMSTAPLAVLRIVFGLVSTAWLISLGPDLFTFFGPSGLMPTPPALGPGGWTLLTLLNSAAGILLVWLVALVAAVALTVGLQTRLAAVVVFVAITSFERRNGMVFNGGDGLLRNLALLVALSPAGAALSWDRWRSAPDRFWESPLHASWALRLIQIQVSVVYLSTVWAKLQGRTWGDGLATTFALRIGDIQRIPTPSFLTDSQVLTELMTFGTLGVEFAIGVLVWNRAARPWVLSLGVLFHLTIELSMMVGFFSIAMVTAYIAFLSPRRAERIVRVVRSRAEDWRRRRYQNVTKPGPTAGVDPVTEVSGDATSEVPRVTPNGASGS